MNEEQLKYLFSLVGYNPTEEQLYIHLSPARKRLVAGGERSGKSYSSAMDAYARSFTAKLLWLVAADYERTKAEFTYLCESFDKAKIAYTATKSVDPGEIIIETGLRIATKSAKDPRKLAMEAPDGIVVCEASQIDYETYLRLDGRLAETRGWMLLSGTFESSLGWYVELYQRGLGANVEDLASFSLPTWSNLKIFPGGRDDPEIKRLEATFPTEWFMERFAGIPTPPKGLVMSEFSNVIHVGVGGDYELDPAGLVYLFVDPGFADAYAVLAVQRRGDHLFVIDEVYERGLITSDIIKVAKQRPWWNRVIGGTIDIAGYQHQAMAAPAEIWIAEGGVSLHAKKLRIQDGIEATKRLLVVNPLTGSPLLHINARCRGLISEWGGCPNPITGQTSVYQWRTGSDGNVIGDVPEDKHNHASKALAYGIADFYGVSSSETKFRVKTW